MLHDGETSPPEVPPLLTFTFADVHSETWPAPHAVCMGEDEGMLGFTSV